jgi:putative FmdB family regulatory protein
MIYEFKCDKCNKINTESLPITTKRVTTACQFCGGIARRIISKSNFILKGKKWASKEGY